VRRIKPRAANGRDISEEAAVFEVCKYVVKGSEFSRVPASQLIELDRALRGRRMLEFWGSYNNRKGYGQRGDAAAPYVHEKTQLTAATAEKRELPKPAKPRARPLRQIGAEMCAAGKEKEWAEMVKDVGYQRRRWRKSDLIARFPFNVFYRIDGCEVLYGISVNPASAFTDDSLSATRLDYKLDLGERMEEIDEASQSERAAWAEVVANPDRREFRAAIAWQERERWQAYVNHGSDGLLVGKDETARNRNKFSWEKTEGLNTPEENKQKIARAEVWKRSTNFFVRD
jgi:hypothetical protein